MGTRPDLTMTPDAVAAFLKEVNVGVLTTLTTSGWPHSAGMWYFVEGDDVKMWTYAKSQKALNASRDPRVSLLVEKGEPYRDLKGVLIRGRVRVTNDPGEVSSIGRRLYDRYVAPRSGVASGAGPDVEIDRQASKRVGLILPLENVVSWDHSKALA
ncbi:MAG: pyridoxamine 5'-phosphate oxidase family protein [Actinobacteria bacterium]|nr:pyridoxamine 5'-phosphate oxidase family protein [Actinomycetota bacterium]